MRLSVNGVPLNGSYLGWTILGKSEIRVGSRYSLTEGGQTGRDGEPVLGRVRGSGLIQLRISTPNKHWESLQALFASPSLRIVSDDGKRATGELVQAHPQEQDYNTATLVAAFNIRIPGGCWRSSTFTSELLAASSLGTQMDLFPRLSAPVQDALIRLKGPIQSPQVADPSGAFVSLEGTVPAGEFVRFHADTGRAWRTKTDVWTGGTEVSGQIDFGGPRGVFEVTPQLAPNDPTNRGGSLSLTQASFGAGSGFQVRGAAAFLL